MRSRWLTWYVTRSAVSTIQWSIGQQWTSQNLRCELIKKFICSLVEIANCQQIKKYATQPLCYLARLLHSFRCFVALMSSSAWCVTVCVRCECMVLSKINELTVRRVNKKLRDAILTCAQKLTWVGLIYRTEPTTEKWKTEKTKKKETDMLRSIGRQSGNPCSQSYHIISEIYSAPITKRT